MQFGVVVRGVIALLGLLGFSFSEEVAAAIEQHMVAIASAIVALVALWPGIKAGFNKALPKKEGGE